jgi:hypothetical protein
MRKPSPCVVIFFINVVIQASFKSKVVFLRLPAYRTVHHKHIHVTRIVIINARGLKYRHHKRGKSESRTRNRGRELDIGVENSKFWRLGLNQYQYGALYHCRRYQPTTLMVPVEDNGHWAIGTGTNQGHWAIGTDTNQGHWALVPIRGTGHRYQ